MKTRPETEGKQCIAKQASTCKNSVANHAASVLSRANFVACLKLHESAITPGRCTGKPVLRSLVTGCMLHALRGNGLLRKEQLPSNIVDVFY